ncbi:CHAT domain-containing protein [Nonomuraea angiospora]|uniref:CHAT domain-containing protein n=1 Tax=Nonomuraea angiospora TaxID=46172 RepID=UPI00344EC2E5
MRGAEFAYLSVCGTGQAGHRLPDEALHIGAAFHLAGFADVVACLWPLSDDFAVRAAEAFYQQAAARGRPGQWPCMTPCTSCDPLPPGIWRGCCTSAGQPKALHRAGRFETVRADAPGEPRGRKSNAPITWCRGECVAPQEVPGQGAIVRWPGLLAHNGPPL